MKTLDQIIRYTSLCSFPEDEWLRVLDYCRIQYGGGHIHRSLKPKTTSTYQQFIDWIDHGLASGDIVKYGHTVGILAYVIPGYAVLAAYLNFEKSLIVENMEVNPQKLLPPHPEEVTAFKTLLKETDITFDVRRGQFTTVYTPKNYSYVFVNMPDNSTRIGILSASTSEGYEFLVMEHKHELEFQCRIPKTGVLLRDATQQETHEFTKTLLQNRLEYMPRTHVLKVINERADEGRKYWYITDRFSVVSAIDRRTLAHNERYDIGNYFTSYTEALTFVQEVKKLRESFYME